MQRTTANSFRDDIMKRILPILFLISTPPIAAQNIQLEGYVAGYPIIMDLTIDDSGSIQGNYRKFWGQYLRNPHEISS